METLSLLLEHNPWWSSGNVAEVAGSKYRFIFHRIIKFLNEPQIITILGQRRVGKTFLMKQVIQHLLERGIPARNILYLPFDELLSRSPDIIAEVLNEYQRSILKEKLRDVWIFFDEIQYVNSWEVMLKRYYDLRAGVKFIVSGSSTAHIKKAKESLAGREYEFLLTPLTFAEFVYFRTGKKHVEHGFSAALLDVGKQLVLERDTLSRLLTEYIIKGGFPELLDVQDYDKQKMYVESLLQKVVYRDIPALFKVEEPNKLLQILQMAARKPGFIANYQRLASDLGITRQTVAAYVQYLSLSGLILIVHKWTAGKIAGLKKSKKIYLSSPTLASCWLHEHEMLKDMSLFIENAFFQAAKGYFWTNAREVDVVLENPLRGIEVKYKDVIKKDDLKGILHFTETFKAEGFVITKDIAGRDQGLIFIPAWLALLAL
ncbi:ATP-binding protein [Candidatus Woesearchaeota archaeon]|nr:ATP-binding protein [Candidatus Woesearchaeota archaeon]